jgi:hypothetical protein
MTLAMPSIIPLLMEDPYCTGSTCMKNVCSGEEEIFQWFYLSKTHSKVLFLSIILNYLKSLYLPGMKVYLTDEKELIMEPSLKWAANPNVTVAVKAFGLKATVQVLCLFQL